MAQLAMMNFPVPFYGLSHVHNTLPIQCAS